MAHKKCVVCNESILNEQGVPYKGRFAHQKCFNIAIKMIQKDKTEKVTDIEKKKRGRPAKPKAELKSGVSEKEYKQKQDYYNYIRNIINGNELSAKIYALSEDYMKRYDFTFYSMFQTLVYLHEIMGKELIGDIVGIIPYYHTEAMQYYTGLLKIEEINKDIDASSMYKEKVICVKPKERKIKQINIESIREEDSV